MDARGTDVTDDARPGWLAAFVDTLRLVVAAQPVPLNACVCAIGGETWAIGEGCESPTGLGIIGNLLPFIALEDSVAMPINDNGEIRCEKEGGHFLASFFSQAAGVDLAFHGASPFSTDNRLDLAIAVCGAEATGLGLSPSITALRRQHKESDGAAHTELPRQQQAFDEFLQSVCLLTTGPQAAAFAGTLSNDGVCPLTSKRAVSASVATRAVQALFKDRIRNSGPFAAMVPAQCDASGGLMLVLPGILGCVIRPVEPIITGRLDPPWQSCVEKDVITACCLNCADVLLNASPPTRRPFLPWQTGEEGDLLATRGIFKPEYRWNSVFSGRPKRPPSPTFAGRGAEGGVAERRMVALLNKIVAEHGGVVSCGVAATIVEERIGQPFSASAMGQRYGSLRSFTKQLPLDCGCELCLTTGQVEKVEIASHEEALKRREAAAAKEIDIMEKRARQAERCEKEKVEFEKRNEAARQRASDREAAHAKAAHAVDVEKARVEVEKAVMLAANSDKRKEAQRELEKKALQGLKDEKREVFMCMIEVLPADGSSSHGLPIPQLAFALLNRLEFSFSRSLMAKHNVYASLVDALNQNSDLFRTEIVEGRPVAAFVQRGVTARSLPSELN